MTIPSRPAPPPPKTNNTNQSSSSNRFPSWDDAPFEFENNHLHQLQSTSTNHKKPLPPPRPPPPIKNGNQSSSASLKKPGQPTSINILSNLFGRSRTPPTKHYGSISSSNLARKNTQHKQQYCPNHQLTLPMLC